MAGAAVPARPRMGNNIKAPGLYFFRQRGRERKKASRPCQKPKMTISVVPSKVLARSRAKSLRPNLKHAPFYSSETGLSRGRGRVVDKGRGF